MSRNRRRFVLLLARFLRHDDEIRASWAEAAARDAAFDGGEWSGPGCERLAERDADARAQILGFANAELARDLAHRFGITASAPAFLYEGIVNLPQEVR